jgi:hypothetical protein
MARILFLLSWLNTERRSTRGAFDYRSTRDKELFDWLGAGRTHPWHRRSVHVQTLNPCEI